MSSTSPVTITVHPATPEPGLVVEPNLAPIFSEITHRTGLIGLARQNTTIALGGTIILLLFLIALCAPLLATHDPNAVAPMKRLNTPSAEFLLGTDMLGRDLYSRVLYGARVSLFVGFSVALLASIVGLAAGLVSGYIRWLDSIVMRIMDGLMSIPGVLLAISLTALAGPSLTTVITAITVVEIPRVARLVRGIVLSLREQTYVEAAIAAGTSTYKIMYRHILPNTLAPLIVQATYVAAAAMLLEAILSFIGAGISPTTPTWGNIMAEGRPLWQIRPQMIFFPSIALSITILAVNLVGDGLRDALDPRTAKRV